MGYKEYLLPKIVYSPLEYIRGAVFFFFLQSVQVLCVPVPVLSPPPPVRFFYNFLNSYQKMKNGLKRMFFYERKKNLLLKEKFQYFMKISGKMFLTDTLAKMSQNIFFCIFFRFRKFCIFFSF